MIADSNKDLSRGERSLLLASILIVALCGIIYELIIGTISSYLLGNSVLQFSLTIGVFMFAMGVGSLISKYFDENYVRNFIYIEIAIAFFGGVSGILLFMAFPFARVIYELVMYGLILIIGALVGMEIPVLSALLSKQSSLKESMANVLSLDYVGALIGSLLFPLLLLPTLGLITSSFLVGLSNIGIAIINVYFFRSSLPNFSILINLCIGILISLILGIYYGARITSFAEQHLYFDQIIFSKQTPYQKLVITRSTTNTDHRLYIDGHIQFSSRDEYRYHEYLVHPLMALPGEKKHILVLGGGDGLAIRELLKYDEIVSIDLVDIDAEILKLGKEQNIIKRLNKRALHSEKVQVYAQDAFSFINREGKLYDRVIVDMPDPHNEAINKLYSKEFYTMIAKRMSPSGAVVTQSSSPFFTPSVYWSISKTLSAVYAHTINYHTSLPSFGIWGFNLASNNVLAEVDYSFDVPTRAITKESFAAAKVFTKDLAHDTTKTKVNSIMNPKLYQLYLSDLSY